MTLFGLSVVSHGVAFLAGAVVAVLVPKFYSWVKGVVGKVEGNPPK
jgi:hypothetical protein